MGPQWTGAWNVAGCTASNTMGVAVAVDVKVGDRPEKRHPEVGGTVSAGFEAVRDAFVDNFAKRGELGGAVCAVVAGEVVVDLWGGLRERAGSIPWSADTMTLVHSTTKGLSAMVLALLHSRGLLDYDQRVAAYWPEFAQAGKEDITVRQLLAHQAGLFAFDERVDRDVVADLDRLAGVMERQRPIWPPGNARRTTRSRLASTKTSWCGASIPPTAPSAGCCTKTSPPRWVSATRSTSGRPPQCPTSVSPP